MAIERHFIDENVKKLVVKKFTEKKLERVGCGNVMIYRTPLGMRVTIFAEKPGLVIGRKGKSVQELTDIFREDFKLENPQIEVQQIEIPEHNANLMAQRVASALERGIAFRRAAYSVIRRVMASGALGIEVIISGKLSGERAKSAKFKEGFILHTGEICDRVVLKGYAVARLKPGIQGVRVKIVPPGVSAKSIIEKPLPSEVQKPAAEEPAAKAPAEASAEAPEGKAAEPKAEEKKAPKAAESKDAKKAPASEEKSETTPKAKAEKKSKEAPAAEKKVSKEKEKKAPAKQETKESKS
ncbi:MAG: 30S ribosomal protein S3 [archaeon]